MSQILEISCSLSSDAGACYGFPGNAIIHEAWNAAVGTSSKLWALLYFVGMGSVADCVRLGYVGH